MYMRLITDPTRLHAYQRDMRQQFAATLDNAPSDALLGAENSVIDAVPVKPAGD